jgi:proline dehydrogenase
MVNMMRALLLFLARREGFKNFALKFGFFRNTASRFIAGETLEDAVAAVRSASRDKISGSLDLLGENTHSQEDADRTCEAILGIFDRIHFEKIDCNVSVKLTQLGLDLDSDFCRENLMRIAGRARERGNFVRVDMEDSHCTERTLDIVERTHEQFDNVGTVIQSYLYRSEQDTARLIEKGIWIRLVKGAYMEPESVAFRRKKDTDSNFIRLMKMLLRSETYNAIATHDESIISATKEFARSENIAKDRFEFQMLYGVRRDLQYRLAEEGYNVRVYIPYGRRWYPYFMRRLAERPANVAFLVRSLMMEWGKGKGKRKTTG